MPDQDADAILIARMEKDYVPDMTIQKEEAMRNALSFIAFRIGRIDDKLGTLINRMGSARSPVGG